jgi:murein DD-endopeptidase MepM/ murein hydrolase activator NlpD
MKKMILILLTILAIGCKVSTTDIEVSPYIEPSLNLRNNLPTNHRFGMPLNYPSGKGYYDANPFGNITKYGKHLGSDLNKLGGGDNDYRDTIYSIGYGVVVLSTGALVAILHKTISQDTSFIVSSYFHCDTIFVHDGKYVTAGEPIALVGKKYTNKAHLHFEILTDTTKTNGFYGDLPCCIDPVKYINNYNK